VNSYSRYVRKYKPYDHKSKNRRTLFLFFLVILLVFLFFQISDNFFLASYSMGNKSMEPSITEGDILLTTPILYGPFIPLTEKRFRDIRQPQRGDIVIARPGYYKKPPGYINAADKLVRFFTLQKISIVSSFYYPRIQDKAVKRVLGIPGDTIKMDNYVIYIKPSDRNYFFHEYELTEREYTVNTKEPSDSWPKEFPFSSYFSEIRLKEDEYFLIGDNRPGSLDSRHWGIVSGQNIIAKAILRYWPFQKFQIP